MPKVIRVAELFAGVGGFRLGLEGWRGKSGSSGYTRKLTTKYKVVWSNQWEPNTKTQIASEIYEQRFGKIGHSNEDIASVSTDDIPTHDLLVGGFPCQDYSVARTLSQASGLIGKKGVLWWQIYRILKESKRKKPKYLFLENVDRLLKSPASQRGRDFAVMLASLSDQDYIVEWRVINAADYGMPQRRRRVFFIAYHKSTPAYKSIIHLKSPIDWVLFKGPIAKAFPVTSNKSNNIISGALDGGLAEITEKFNNATNDNRITFDNSGIMIKRKYYSLRTAPHYSGAYKCLGDIIIKDSDDIPPSFYIDKDSLKKWEDLKGSKNIPRVNKSTGHKYFYAEGSMAFPDSLEKPARTIVTGEGGSTPSRFKHVIKVEDGKYRRLMPIELERINMFPDNHTEGASDTKRAFLMGNALVVGVVERIGEQLQKIIVNNAQTTSIRR